MIPARPVTVRLAAQTALSAPRYAQSSRSRCMLSPANHPAFLLPYIDAAVGSESNSARSLAISFCTLSK